MTDNGTEQNARATLAALRARYPDAPFLALGQTVFWDEPMKAALYRLLQEDGTGGRMVVGVHDTDYFARSRARARDPRAFVLMPHNDGTTKELWSAAGEISTLFGSETFPSRHEFARCGVAFRRAARASGLERQAFVDAVTEAWGWRGLVYTGSRDLIVCHLPLREVGDSILEMLAWGFDRAVEQVAPGCCQGEARSVADAILGWCRGYQAEHPDRTLSDLYQFVLPRLYELLLHEPPQGLTVSGTADLLRFTPETFHLPRFRFVGLFLDPSTRDAALAAYDEAVSGSEIYTLDKFGKGALPFDLIAPGHGRGTLRLTPRVLFAEFRQPVAVGLDRPVETLEELAAVLHRRFGDDVTLVGKAVSLVSMLAQEFVFVFHEEGSLYVRRTRQMNDRLAAQGVELDMRPILRLRYHTWDALAVGRSSLRAAPHLASAFNRSLIPSSDFAAEWPGVLREQRELCETLAALRKPVALLHFLRDRDPSQPWDERCAAHVRARTALHNLRRDAESVQDAVRAAHAELREAKAQRLAVQTRQGEHFRATTEWTPAARLAREDLEQEKRTLDARKRALCVRLSSLKARRREIERGPEAAAARRRLAEIEGQAELARLRLVRDALLTVEGLPHTNHRPSAWWIPMLDRSGDWFRRITQTAELYAEPLISE